MRTTRLKRKALAWMSGPALFLVGAGAVAGGDTDASGKVPITTSSEEARELYLKGRDLAEKLRATDARPLLQQAVAKDKDFAVAYLALAGTAGTAKEFFDSVNRAVAASSKVSKPEQDQILGLEAGVRGNPMGQKARYTNLVQSFPNDERAHNLLAGYYFGQQDYAAAVEEYKKATAINPSFSQPYNQMGYAYRFLGKYDEAEAAFKKYVELIPGDPNPYDSYAELLMKTGRFDESIVQYKKALSHDENFIASYIGIGVNYTIMGRYDDARGSFGALTEHARNDGERRQALFWTAFSYVHEGATDKALETMDKQYAIAEKGADGAAMSGDLNLMGEILLDAGKPDQALEKYKLCVQVMDKANVPVEVKEATRRNLIWDEARVALAKQDLETAKARAAAYAKQVAGKSIPFEVRQQHELAGLVAMAEKDYETAAAELARGNQQDPRVLYNLGLALQGKGDGQPARENLTKAANFNGLNFNYGYVRKKAQQALKS